MSVCRTAVLLLGALLVSPSSGISLDARNSDIGDVLQQLSAQANIDVVVGPGVRGKVTLFLGEVEAARALEALASAGGWAVYQDAGIYRFITREEYERRTGNQYGAWMKRRTFSLRHVTAALLGQTLGGMVSPGGKLVVEPESNTISVVDRADVVEEMARIIATADTPQETKTIQLSWLSPEEAITKIKAMLGPSGTAIAHGVGGRVVLRDRGWRLRQAEEILQALDRPPPSEPAFMELRYLSSDSISTLLSRLESRRLGSNLTPVGRSGLMLEDTPHGVVETMHLLSGIDTPGTTIEIEAKILQVSLTREVSTGIDWQLLADRLDGLSVHAAFPMDNVTGPGVDVHIGDVADDDYEVLFSMLESFGEVELLSRPTLTALSGTEAELVVGSRVPYATIDSREDVNGGVTRYQRVVYLDVGLKLWLRPYYHGDGNITLEIKPEISSVTGYVDAIDTRLPIVETTNAKVHVTVPVGKTVVIGGLIREGRKKTSRGVPLLRSIPLIGALFRYEVEEISRGELVIFVTPRLLGDQEAS